MSPGDMQQYLEGVEFPVPKSELVNKAKSNDAPPEIIDALNKIPDKSYQSPADLSQEISKGM